MRPARHLLFAAMLLACCACGRGTARAEPPAATGGSIEGRILHPGHVVPPLRICAIGSGPAPTHACIRTRGGQARYRIAGLAEDDYVVISEGGDSAYRIGAHVLPVQCIRAPCPEMPAAVHVAPGAQATAIDLNGFYLEREDFPPMPAE